MAERKRFVRIVGSSSRFDRGRHSRWELSVVGELLLPVASSGAFSGRRGDSEGPAWGQGRIPPEARGRRPRIMFCIPTTWHGSSATDWAITEPRFLRSSPLTRRGARVRRTFTTGAMLAISFQTISLVGSAIGSLGLATSRRRSSSTRFSDDTRLLDRQRGEQANPARIAVSAGTAG